MKKIRLFLIISVINLIHFTDIKSQQNDIQQDTIKDYLLKKTKELLKPHSDLSFSFGTDELKNELPDLKVIIPDLKDTAKYLEELKGDYTDWLSFHKIGNLYQRYKKMESAKPYYEQAYNLITTEIKKDSTNSKYYSDLATLYMDLDNQEYAFYCFQKAYELNNKDSMASSLLPMLYLNMGNIDEANKVIEKNIQNEDNNVINYIWMVFSNVLRPAFENDEHDMKFRNQTIDEIFDFSKINEATKKNKSDIRFKVLLQLSRQLALFIKYASISLAKIEEVGLTENDKKELKNIRKSLEKFISKDEFKSKYILYKALGFNYILDKNINKANEMFKKAMDYWPADKRNEDYYILFSVKFFLQNDTTAAIAILDEKIENNRKYIQLNSNDFVLKGNIFLAKNEFQKAVEQYDKALEEGYNADALLGLSFMELKEGKLQEANQFINKAYEINSQYYLTYALFGIITIMNNQMTEAKDALKKALELKPDNETIKELYSAFFTD